MKDMGTSKITSSIETHSQGQAGDRTKASEIGKKMVQDLSTEMGRIHRLISEKTVEEELRDIRDKLIVKLQVRHEDLVKANELLQAEIAERKRTEETLRQSEERYRTILESIEDGYYEVDLAGNFVFFNDAMCTSWIRNGRADGFEPSSVHERKNGKCRLQSLQWSLSDRQTQQGLRLRTDQEGRQHTNRGGLYIPHSKSERGARWISRHRPRHDRALSLQAGKNLRLRAQP